MDRTNIFNIHKICIPAVSNLAQQMVKLHPNTDWKNNPNSINIAYNWLVHGTMGPDLKNGYSVDNPKSFFYSWIKPNNYPFVLGGAWWEFPRNITDLQDMLSAATILKLSPDFRSTISMQGPLPFQMPNPPNEPSTYPMSDQLISECPTFFFDNFWTAFSIGFTRNSLHFHKEKYYNSKTKKWLKPIYAMINTTIKDQIGRNGYPVDPLDKSYFFKVEAKAINDWAEEMKQTEGADFTVQMHVLNKDLKSKCSDIVNLISIYSNIQVTCSIINGTWENWANQQISL